METKMGGGGGVCCSLSGVLLRKIFQNWALKFTLPDNLLTPSVERLFCAPKRPQIWERVGSCTVSHFCYLVCSAYVCFYSGNASSSFNQLARHGGHDNTTQNKPSRIVFPSLSTVLSRWMSQWSYGLWRTDSRCIVTSSCCSSAPSQSTGSSRPTM